MLRLIIMIGLMVCYNYAKAQEAYAVYTNDGTLTFYYDKQKSSRSGTKYAMNKGSNAPGWYTDHRKDIKKAVFNSSFAKARPTSTYEWFSVKASEKSVLANIVGIQYLNTSEVTNMGWMFAYCINLKELDVSHFNTSKATSMSGMFCDCSSLTTLDVSNFNTSKVTSMSAMFDGCTSLASLNVSNFNTSNVTDFWYIFKDCSSLKSINVSNFNTSKVTDFCAMFSGCSSLTTIDVSNFNTSNATRLNSMFDDCSSLTSLDLSSFNTSKVTGMSFMFSGCKSLKTLDISHLNSANVTTMSGMFDDCSGLTSLDLSHLDTRNVTEMGWMFNGCTKLTSLDLSTFNTGKVTEMKYMFDGCTSLTTIYAGEGWNTNKVTSSSDMFRNCTKLVGGAGTKYNTNHVDVAYAHIDGGVSNPGYLTDKNAPAAKEAYAVYTDDGTLTFYYDAQRNSRTGSFHLNSGTDYPEWKYYSWSKNIKKVVFNSSFAEARPISTSYWFSYSVPYELIGGSEKSVLSEIVGIEYLNTSEVRTMNWMFNDCTALTSLDVSHFDTSKVTNMGCMFGNCNGLTSLDVTNFNTSNVTAMYSMFNGCNKLTSLDLSHFDTSNVTDMRYMFQDCTNLKTIYVGDGWNTDNMDQSENMFLNCTNLVGGAGTKYDANHVDATYAHIDGSPSNPGYLTDKNATSLMNLQEFIDANAGATSVVDVDLSKFYDVVRDVTLNVSTGASYRFFNGTLSRSENLNAPVMYISNGSTVEISDGAIVTSQGHLADDLEGQFKVEATIKMDGGSLYIIGGKVEGACGSRNHGMVLITTSDEEDPAVELTNDNDSFMMTGGEVRGYLLCNAKNANISFMGGEINGHYFESQPTRATPYHIYEPLINTYSDIHINGLNSHTGCRDCITIIDDGSNGIVINEFFVSLHGTSKVHLHKGGIDTFTFTVDGRKDGDVLMIGENYIITDEDMAGMSVKSFSYYSEKVGHYLKQECYLELKNNKVYLRFKTDELPNTGCDEEWLQQKLDEIASKKPSEPVELTICEDGITLTKNILVDKDCKVVLTGGPITSETSIDYRYGREGLFMVYGELGFHDITLTFNNDAKGDGSLGYFWSGDGILELNKETVVFTTNGTVVGGFGKLNVTDAVLFAGGEEMIFSPDINTTISDYVQLRGQKTYCNGKIAINMKTNPETGMVQLPIFLVEEVHVTKSLDLWAPNNNLHSIYLYKDASINTYENGFMPMKISGEWDQMAVGRAFVTSESIGQDDYNNMTFTGMPIDRKAEFVPGNHQVRLMSTSQIDMQTSLSGLTYVSQTNPITLYLNSDAVNTVYQSATINHQNVTFNGMPNGATSRSRLHFTKDQILTIGKVGRLTLANIDITGEDGNEGFDVNGKLIISENVHVSNLPCLLHICTGGSVYASAALRNPINIQFVNGLASGNTVIAGTDGYQLTETDLDYITVEGCELQLDKGGNRIIALNGTGIEAIKIIPRTTLQEGIFDLSGRKVVPARQGMYIIKDGDKARKIYVK